MTLRLEDYPRLFLVDSEIDLLHTLVTPRLLTFDYSTISESPYTELVDGRLWESHIFS